MIIAVDPGIHGALCFNDWKGGRLEIVRMPTLEKIVNNKPRNAIDEAELLSLVQCFAAMGATHLFLEAVGGMPGQSAPAAFTFGQGYGAVRMAAMACGLKLQTIPASVWKAVMKVPADKRGARGRASEMIPTHKHLWSMAKDDGMAEAALLSLWAHRWLEGGFTQRTKKERVSVATAAKERARRTKEAQKARRAGTPHKVRNSTTARGFPRLNYDHYGDKPRD